MPLRIYSSPVEVLAGNQSCKVRNIRAKRREKRVSSPSWSNVSNETKSVGNGHNDSNALWHHTIGDVTVKDPCQFEFDRYLISSYFVSTSMLIYIYIYVLIWCLFLISRYNSRYEEVKANRVPKTEMFLEEETVLVLFIIKYRYHGYQSLQNQSIPVPR